MNKVQICNTALQRVGVTQKIESLDESSVEAEVCNTVFDMVVDMVYEDGQFPNMLSYKQLALITKSPNDEWLYAYDHPNDAMTVKHIVMPYEPQNEYPFYDSNNSFVHQFEIEFARGRYDNRDVIFSNKEEAVAACLESPDENSNFESKIASLIAWKLGVEIGTALGIDFNRSDRAAQYYDRELRAAMANVRNERQERDPQPAFITARGGY